MSDEKGNDACVKRIWTVTVWVSDMKRSIGFFTKMLGLRVALDSEKDNWVELSTPDGFTKVALQEPTKELGEDYYKWATQNIGVKTGISFQTEDIDGLYEDLKAKGVKFSGPPARMPWGGTMTTFVDLDGNEFSIVEDKEHYERDYS